MYKFRNPKYTADGRIDVEIDHPDLGWVPFTIDPSEQPVMQQQALSAGPAPHVPYVPTLVEKRAESALPFSDLVSALVSANVITLAEAKAWAKDGKLPDTVVSAIDALPNIKEQAQAYVEGRVDSGFSRNSTFIEALRVAYNHTDAQVDTLFRIT